MKLNLKNLLFNAVMALLIGLAASTVTGGFPALLSLGIFAAGCLLPAVPANAAKVPFAFMAVQQSIWIDSIEENVYPDNSFMMQSRDDGAFLEGRTVKLNQAGGKPGVQKNRVVLPATATKRVDTTADYDIDEFTTDPIVLTKTEEIEASYDKRQSVLFDHTEVLKNSVAEGMAFAWTPSVGVNVIRTTGASRTPYKIFQMGAGSVNRKRISKEDIEKAATILNSQDVPQDGRYMLIDAVLIRDLLAIEAYTSLEKIGKAVLTDGAIGRVMGFDVFVRSSTVIFDGADMGKMEATEATSANDHVSTLFWQKNYVRRCFGGSTNGGIEVFEDSGSTGNGNPLFYGTVLSALVRSGGRIARADERGVVVLVEDLA